MVVVVDPGGHDSAVMECKRAIDPGVLLPAPETLEAAFFLARQHQAGADLVLLEEMHHVDEDVVALGFDLGDGLALSLRLAAFDKALLQGLVPFGKAQIGPWKFQSGIELLDESAHAAGATRRVIGEEGPHEGPAHAGRIDDRVVDIGCGADILVEDMERLPPQGLLQAIADIAVDLLLETQDMHADGIKVLAGAVHRFEGGLLARDGFDQRQQIDRVEGVGDDHTAGICAFGLKPGRQEA